MLLDFFSSFFFSNSGDTDTSYSYSYSYSRSSKQTDEAAYLTFVYTVLAQLAPFLVLLGLPALALLTRGHWHWLALGLVRIGEMVLESLSLVLPWNWGSGSSSGGSGSSGEEREEKRRRRKDRKREKEKDGEGRGGRGSQSQSQSETDRESEIDEDEDEGLHYPGLVNISGTYCFLNSVLQATASLAYLQPYLDAIHVRAVDLDVPTPVVDTLEETLQALNTPKTSRSSLRPVPIINALSQPIPGSIHGKSKLFASREHQDAQELFQLLSECIKSEAQAVDAEAQRDRGLGAFASTSSSMSSASSTSSLLLRSREGTGTSTPGGEPELSALSVFDGLTANRRSCVVCGYTEAVMHFAFATWSLALPSVGFGSPSSCSLQECLSEYTRLELLTDCVCRRCSMRATHTRLREEADKLAEATKPGGPAAGSQYKKKKTKEVRRMERLVGKAIEEGRIEEDLGNRGVRMERVVSPASTKQAMIARPPKILVLHLNRSLHLSSYTSPSRNPVRVRFPEILDLTPYTTSGQLSTQPSAPISTPPPPLPQGGIGIGIGVPRSTTPTQGMYDHPRVLYRLSSVVVHYGAHSFGHYVCFRRKPRFSRRKKKGRGDLTVPQMPCPYGCECSLCTTHGPVRDLDPSSSSPPLSSLANSVSVSTSASNSTSLPNSQSQSQTETHPPPQTQTQTYRPPKPNKGWLRISDDTVEEVGLERVLAEGSGAFLLFYERVQSPWYPRGYMAGGGVGASASVGVSASVSGSQMIGVGERRGETGIGMSSSLSSSSMGIGLGMRPSQPIGIGIGSGTSSGRGAGAGSIYQHLKTHEKTPRSSEETVRPADVVSVSNLSSLSHLSTSNVSTSTLSVKSLIEREREREAEDGWRSGSVSSSVSSSLSSSWNSGYGSWGNGSGSGIVRPRVVRRTTAGQRERSKESEKENKPADELEVNMELKGKEKEIPRDETAQEKIEATPKAEEKAEGFSIPNGSAIPPSPHPSLPLPNGRVTHANDMGDELSESIVKVELPSPPRSRSPSPNNQPRTKHPSLPSSAPTSTSDSLPRAPSTPPPSSPLSLSPPPSPTSPHSAQSPTSPSSPISPSKKRKAGKNKSRIPRARVLSSPSPSPSPASGSGSGSVSTALNVSGKVNGISNTKTKDSSSSSNSRSPTRHSGNHTSGGRMLVDRAAVGLRA